jgi:hypothetical protein
MAEGRSGSQRDCRRYLNCPSSGGWSGAHGFTYESCGFV